MSRRRSRQQADAASPESETGAPESKQSGASVPFSPRTLPSIKIDNLPDIPAAWHWWVAGALLLLAAALRFFNLGTHDLWFDEVQSYYDGIFLRPKGDSHWLFFHVMKWFGDFVADPTLSVRIYPAITGILAVPLVYIITAWLAPRWVALLAALMLCFQSFHIYYSQEARYYAPMVFFTLVGLWAALLFLRTASLWRWFLLPVAGAACWLSVLHHPASLPWSLAHGLWLVALVSLSPWGLDAVRQVIPPLRRVRALPFITGGVGLLCIAGAAIAAPKLRTRIIDVLFKSEWGGTPEVDFTWSFFAKHLTEFGWNLAPFPALGAVVNLLLWLVGIALLLRYATWVGLGVMGSVIAVFVAVFAFSRPDSHYLFKYSCTMQPLIMIPVAIGLGWLSGLAFAKLGEKFTVMRFAGPVALMVVVTVLSAAALPRLYTMEKMPLRPQLTWLNENETEPAKVWLYGHMGYLGVLYGSTLDARHQMEYFPWHSKTGTGEAEVQMLIGQAKLGRPVYFARAWHWDMPEALDKFLREKCEVAHSITSIDGPEQDGILYRIPADVTPERGRSRPAGHIDEFERFRRPEISGGDRPTILVKTAMAVRYALPVKAGRSYRIRLEGESREARPWYFSVRFDDHAEAQYFAFENTQGQAQSVEAILLPTQDAEWVTIAHVSDIAERPSPANGGFLLRTITVEEIISAEPVTNRGLLDPGKVEVIDYTASDPLKGWSGQPATLIDPKSQRIDESGNLAVRLEGTDGMIIGPMRPVRTGTMVAVRTGLRPVEVYGIGGNAVIIFLDTEGRPIQQHYLSTTSYESRVKWAPVHHPLHYKNHWYHFEGLRPVPPGATNMVIAYPIWKLDYRRYPNAANELQWRPVEITGGR